MEPALIQLIVTTAIGVLCWVLILRWRRLACSARERKALEDYLLGVEQALAGDLTRAIPRLEHVLREDPENHHARLLLAELLAARGEHETAHQHHVFLHRAFGYATDRNDLAMARSLLAVARPAEAITAAERAVSSTGSAEALQCLFRANLAAGQPVEAADAGQRLLSQLPPGPERDEVEATTARALLQAAEVQLRAGATTTARILVQRASTMQVRVPELPRVALSVLQQEGGVEQVRTLLLAEVTERTVPHGRTTDALVALLPDDLLPDVQTGRVRNADAPLANWLRAVGPGAAYSCRTCGRPAARQQALCKGCLMPTVAVLREPLLFTEIRSASEWMDEIEVTSTHVRRLVRLACESNQEAEDDLVELGEGAVEEVLAGVAHHRAKAPVLAKVLRQMGPSILPKLFSVHLKWKEQGLRRLFGLFSDGARDDLIGQVIQEFGREALPFMESLWTTQDRDLRRLIVDFVIGLSDQDEFRRVLDQFPPVEVIQRTNETGAEPLIQFLGTVQRASMVVDAVLLQPTFRRERELLKAAALAPDPSILEEILVLRGPGEVLVPVLIEHLGDPDAGPVAERVLAAFGAGVVVHLVHAFADPEQPEPVRERCRRRILAVGAHAVLHVVDAFGPRPSILDQDLVDLLIELGAEAVPALAQSFRPPGGLVDRLYGAVVSRYSHRRVMILRALAGIGLPAETMVEELSARETDTNLKLRLEQTRKKIRDVASDSPAPAPADDHDQPGEGHEQAG